MAFISTYSTTSPVIATDKWIGTSANDGSTKNFTAQAVSDFVYPRSIVNTTLTTYTFQLTTENKTLTYTGSGAATFTIETQANIAFTTGCEILVCNQSSDTITVSPASGVTLFGTATIAAGESKRLKKTNTNTWSMY